MPATPEPDMQVARSQAPQDEDMAAVLIRYQPDIRINGQPHGPVYAIDLGDLYPGVHMRTVFSGTPDPEAATRFAPSEAQTLIACHPFSEVAIVEADDAPPL
jgi:hypothetical protein